MPTYESFLTEAHLQALSAAGIGLWSLNPQTGDIQASDCTYELLRLAPTTTLNVSTLRQQLHADDQIAFEVLLQAALSPMGTGRLTLECQARSTEPEGQPRWLRFTGQTTFAKQHAQAQQLAGTLADITAAKVVATAAPKALDPADLRESEFMALVNTVAQLAWMAEPDGHIFWYNDRWYEYTGTNLAQMQGWGWEKVHHPDYIEQVVAFVKKAWLVSEPFELTFPLRGHDGIYRWFLTRAVPILDAEGRILRWFGTNTDVTEMRRLQDQLERAYQDLEVKVTFRTLQLEREVQQLRAQLPPID